MIHNSHIDMQSVQGTILSLFLILLAKIFAVINLLGILQGIAYFLSIIIAIDTLTGGHIRKYLTDKIKNWNEPKCKGPCSNKKV